MLEDELDQHLIQMEVGESKSFYLTARLDNSYALNWIVISTIYAKRDQQVQMTVIVKSKKWDNKDIKKFEN